MLPELHRSTSDGVDPPYQSLHTLDLLSMCRKIEAAGAERVESTSTASPASRRHMLRKRIVDPPALRAWQSSDAYRDVMAYVNELAAAVAGVPLTQSVPRSPIVCAIHEALDTMSRWVAEIPAQRQAMRYGNVAFKTWHARLCEYATSLMNGLLLATTSTVPGATAAMAVQLPQSFVQSAIPTRVAYEASLLLSDDERRAIERQHSSAAARTPAPPSASGELSAYFAAAFGDATRIDYGTGHELAFLVWLRCLDRLALLAASDRRAVVVVVIQRYLLLMRQLQTTYWLEPAGSHGVWGLDDYQFLPFLLGAAQLVDHPEITPSSIHDERLLESEGDAWLYLAAVKFIRMVKRGHFGEHSPMLNDVSGLGSWRQVASGLVRMYEGEVLGKLPVVQHLHFGSLLRWDA